MSSIKGFDMSIDLARIADLYLGTANGRLGTQVSTAKLIDLANNLSSSAAQIDAVVGAGPNILMGDVVAEDGTTVILQNGTDGTDAQFQGRLRADDGASIILDNGTDGTDAYFMGDVQAEDGSDILTSGATVAASSLNVGSASFAAMSLTGELTLNDGVLDGTNGDAEIITPDAAGATLQNLASVTATTFNGSLRGLVDALDGTNVLFNGSDGTDAFYVGDVYASNVTDLILVSGADRASSFLNADVRAADGVNVVLDQGTNGTDAVLTGDIAADDGTVVVTHGTFGSTSRCDFYVGEFGQLRLAGSDTLFDATVDGTKLLSTGGQEILNRGTDGTDAWFEGDVRAENGALIVTSGATPNASSITVGTVNADVIGDIAGSVLADNADVIVISGATKASSFIDVGLVTGTLNGNLVSSDGIGVVVAQGTDGTNATIRANVLAEENSTILVSGTNRSTSYLLCPIRATDGTNEIFNPGTDGTDAWYEGQIRADDATVVLDNGTDGTDAWFEGDVRATGSQVVLDIGATRALTNMYIGAVNAGDLKVYADNGSFGGGVKRTHEETEVAVTADPSVSTNFSIPIGSKLIAVQIRVDSALAVGETWDAEWNDGATIQAIATNQAVTGDTKVSAFFDENADSAITDADTEVVISPNGGGNFTAQGSFTVVAIYEELVTPDSTAP